MSDTTIRFASVPVFDSEVQIALELLWAAAQQHKASSFHFVNAYSVVLAHQDPQLLDIYNSAMANFCDGKSVSWASSLGGSKLRQVRGPGLFRAAFEISDGSNFRHFLLGSTPDTLGKLRAKIALDFPQAVIAGSLSPKFGDFDEQETRRIDSAIQESKANIVWVGLGTPKQDFEASRISSTCDIPTVAVGAAFDFLAGTKNEAPKFLQSVGLEWLFRFLSEPRRLWKRYLVGNLLFIAIAARQLLGFFK